MQTLPLARVPGWLWVWALLSGAVLLVRPALPIDETRYLAVAWEMWWRDSYVVPYLNGELYDGKPPLLFWLMQSGWWLFGVSEWWPRLLGPLFGLGCLFLVRALARRLWPEGPAADAAPWLLLGSLLWAFICAATMFDMLLGFFALTSVYAIVRAWQDRKVSHFALVGLALGFGILAKGPVVFLPSLFVVLAAPWWQQASSEQRIAWRAWYAAYLGAAGIAALMALAWLVPMRQASNPEYLHDMLFQQTLGYTVNSFSHALPFWWYVPLLPLLLFPWILWPRAWSALGALKSASPDAGTRLCLIWTIGVFVTFSAISGKRPHYLLLMFPAIALLLARLLPASDRDRDNTLVLPVLAYVAIAVALFVAASGPIPRHAARWLSSMPQFPLYAAGGMLLMIGAAVFATRAASLAARIRALAGTTCLALFVLTWAAMGATGPAYDVRPMSRYLAEREAAGVPVAVVGRYHGEYVFYGRLKRPVARIEKENALQWARAHPEGVILGYYRAGSWPRPDMRAPAYEQLYRSGTMAAWRSSDVIADARLVESLE